MAIETNLNKRIVTGEDIDVTVALNTTAKKVHPAVNELKTLIDNQTIKDLSHLTTQDEYFNALEAGKYYIVKDITGTRAVVYCYAKSATTANVAGEVWSVPVKPILMIFNKGGANLITFSANNFSIPTPTQDLYAANKKYVDDNAGGLFGDGTETTSQTGVGYSKGEADAEFAKKLDNPTNAGTVGQIIKKTAAGTEWETVFTQNSDLLLKNDIVNNGDAYIGKGFSANQYYGSEATGDIHIGQDSERIVTIGQFSKTGDIRIGSNLSKVGDGQGVLIHGDKLATFEEIIDTAKGGHLSKTLTLVFDDGTTEDVKVG